MTGSLGGVDLRLAHAVEVAAAGILCPGAGNDTRRLGVGIAAAANQIGDRLEWLFDRVDDPARGRDRGDRGTADCTSNQAAGRRLLQRVERALTLAGPGDRTVNAAL